MFQPVEDLPVRLLYMVGLGELLHCQLPVARQRDGSIPAEAQLLEFIVPSTLVDGIEELLKRFRVVIHVDEHEAAPAYRSRTRCAAPTASGSRCTCRRRKNSGAAWPRQSSAPASATTRDRKSVV